MPDPEIESRLLRMRREGRPSQTWPEGCYGSMISWLLFVGPSPGGRPKDGMVGPRNQDGGEALWNTDYLEPFEQWSPGFRASFETLVETIVGLPIAQGAGRLYGVANFDWVPNPDGADVPVERMTTGVPDVLRVLDQTIPKVIVTLEGRSHNLLEAALSERYELLRTPVGRVFIRIGEGEERAHRTISAFQLGGIGPLSGAIVVKSPQHPARIFNRDYASRCARAVRSVVEQIAGGATELLVREA
jgi:hypothetical protein